MFLRCPGQRLKRKVRGLDLQVQRGSALLSAESVGDTCSLLISLAFPEAQPPLSTLRYIHLFLLRSGPAHYSLLLLRQTLIAGSVYRIGRGVGPPGNDRKIHDGGEMQPANNTEKYKLAENVDGGSIRSIQWTDGASVDALTI